MKQQASRHRAKDGIAHVLPPSVDVREEGDLIIINGTPLRAHWLGEGWLRDVKRLLDQEPDLPDIVVAKRMSPAARDALARASIGWVDESGAAEIAVGPIVVVKSGRPAVQRITRWTPSVMAVAEALLCGAEATVVSAQDVTGLSSGSCTNALRFLVDQDLLTADARRGPNSGRRVADFDRLLDEYASAVTDSPAGRTVHVGMTWRDVVEGLVEIGASWNDKKRGWACTGAVAASVYAPYLTSVNTADVYVDVDTVAGLEAAAAEAGLQPLVGGRLKLQPFPTPTAEKLAIEKEGLCLAPWPRVYADLRLTGVRGEEAAEHLREVMSVR